MRTKNQRIMKRLTILGTLACLLLVLVLGLSVVRNRMKTRTLEESRREGLAAYQEGNLKLAAEKLGYYHASRSDDPDVAYKLADARMRLPAQGSEGLKAAVQFARQAAELASGRAEPLELLLELHAQLNQQTERLAIADRLLRQDAKNTKALDARARALLALGRRSESMDAARQLTDLTPGDPEAHRLVFLILSTEDPTIGRTQMAEYVATLGEDHPDDPRFAVLRIHASALMGDLDSARAIAATLEGADLGAETLAEVMRSFDLLGLREAGDAMLARHAEKPELLRVTSLLGVQRSFMRGQIERAAEFAARALSAENAASPDLLPWALASGVEVPDSTFDRVLASADRDTTYHTLMRDGLRALLTGDPGTARSAFAGAQSIRRDDPLAGALLADAMDRIGAWKDAALTRREVLRRTPEFTTVRLAHVESLLSRGRPLEADAAVREGLELDPSNGALLLAHILAVSDLASLGQARPEELRGARAIAEAMEDGSESVTPVTIPLARLLVAINESNALEPVLSRILAADAATLDLRSIMALALAMQESGHPRAGELLALIDRSDNTDPYIVLERATSIADAGDTAGALALIDRKLQSARSQSPEAALRMEMARVAFLDRTSDAGAPDALRRLSDEHSADAVAQSLVLESQAAWSERQLIADAIARLRAVTGDTSTGWKVHEARRMLAFDPTEQSAASVVGLLKADADEGAADAFSLLVLADAMSILGDSHSAADYLARAIDAGIDSPALILRLISIRQSMGDIDNARRRALALAQVEPVSPQIRRERVAALIRLGSYDAARADADLLAQENDARSLVIAAAVSAKLGSSAETTRRLDKLLALESIPGDMLTACILTLTEAGRSRDAFALLERQRPADPPADFTLAEATLLEVTGRPEDAAALLAQRAAAKPDPVLLAAQARVLSRLGRVDEARSAADAGLALAPSDQELRLLKEAIGLVSPVHSESIGEDAQAARRVIDALRKFTVETSNPPELVRQLRLITEEEPSFYPAWSVLTTQLQSQGRFEEAAETAQTAMRLLPGDPRPARLAVDALLLINQPRRALAAADEWSRRSREDSYEADTTMAALHMRLGSPTSAAQTLRPWMDRIAADQDAAPILIRLLAVLEIIRGDQNSAWRLIQPRADQDQRWLAHAIEISRDLIQNGAPATAAAAWLDRVTDQWQPGTEDTLRVAQARLDLATATGSESDLIAVQDTLKRLAAMPGQSDWITRGAKLIQITADRMLGRRDDANLAARELAAARPDDSIALSVFALTQVEADASAAEALRAAQRAVQLAEATPDDPAMLTTALDALGRSQLASGLTADAESTFRRLLGLQSGSVSARLGLAEVFAATQRTAEARQILNDQVILDAVRRSPHLQARVAEVRARIGG